MFGHNSLSRKDSFFNIRKMSNSSIDHELRRPSRLRMVANDPKVLKSSRYMAMAWELGLTGSSVSICCAANLLV